MKTTRTLPPSAEVPPPAASSGLLDPAKRKLLLILLAKGLSRRAASQVVDCHVATIGRTAQRDPQFAQALAEAEVSMTLASLDCVQQAARSPRYWRAAAWVLERTDPDRFAPRRPQTTTAEELGTLAHRILDVVAAAGVSPSQLSEIETRVEQLLSGADEQAAPSGEDVTPGVTIPDSLVPPSPATESSARNTPPQSPSPAPSPQPTVTQQVTSPNTAPAERATPVQGVARQPQFVPQKSPQKPDELPPSRSTGHAKKRHKDRHARKPQASPCRLSWDDLDPLPTSAWRTRTV